jgi:hypothetical protein
MNLIKFALLLSTFFVFAKAQTNPIEQISYNSPKVCNIYSYGIIPTDTYDQATATANSNKLANILQQYNTIIIPDVGKTYFFNSGITISSDSKINKKILGINNPELNFKLVNGTDAITIISQDEVMTTLEDFTINLNNLGRHGLFIKKANRLRIKDVRINNCNPNTGDGVHIEPNGDYCYVENAIFDNVYVNTARDGFSFVIPNNNVNGPHFINECQFRNCEARVIKRNPIRYELHGGNYNEKVSNILWTSFNSEARYSPNDQLRDEEGNLPAGIYVYKDLNSPSTAQAITYIGGVIEQGGPNLPGGQFIKANLDNSTSSWSIQNLWPVLYTPSIINVNAPFVNFGEGNGNVIRRFKDPSLEIEANVVKCNTLVQPNNNILTKVQTLNPGVNTISIPLESVYPAQQFIGSSLQIELFGNEYYDSDLFSYNYMVTANTVRASWTPQHFWSFVRPSTIKGSYSRLISVECSIISATKTLNILITTSSTFGGSGANKNCYVTVRSNVVSN